MASMKSVGRPAPGAGVPAPKGEYIYLYDVDDIAKFPVRVPGTKNYATGLELKADAKGTLFYATAGTIEPVIEKTGETDAVGFKNGFKWSYPGDNADAVIEVMSNRSFIGITKTCKGSSLKVYGSDCKPLRLQTLEVTDNNEANKRSITLQQVTPDDCLPMIYTGELPPVAEPEAETPPTPDAESI